MISLGKVLVGENEQPEELLKVPEKLRKQTIYQYAKEQIDGIGWRPDYAVKALAMLENSQCDLGCFRSLPGVSIVHGKVEFDLAAITEWGYEMIGQQKDERIYFGVLKFAKSKGHDIDEQRLIDHGLELIQKDFFHGLPFLSGIVKEGLAENVFDSRMSQFLDRVDKNSSDNTINLTSQQRFANYIVERALEGDFTTASLMPRFTEKFGVVIDRDSYENILRQEAEKRIARGDSSGISYFYSIFGFGHNTGQLNSLDLSLVVRNCLESLLNGDDIEKNICILSRVPEEKRRFSESEKGRLQDIAWNYLMGKIKKTDWDSIRFIESYCNDLDSLHIEPKEDDVPILVNSFLQTLAALTESLAIKDYIGCSNLFAMEFDEICEVGYHHLKKGNITLGIRILREAYTKFSNDEYVDETGDNYFLRADMYWDEKKYEAPFKNKIVDELKKRNLYDSTIDACFEQVKQGDYENGILNLRFLEELIYAKPDWEGRMSPNKIAEVACRTMETKHMFYRGMALLRRAVELGAEFDQDTFTYLANLEKKKRAMFEMPKCPLMAGSGDDVEELDEYDE